jgi:hypothetical protein
MAKFEDAGMIVYDIPDTLKPFGNFLRSELRKGGALPVNLSVYLVNWADVPRLNRIIERAKVKYRVEIDNAERLVQKTDGGFHLTKNGRLQRPLRVNILKFDNKTGEEAMRMAREGIAFLVADLHRALDERMKKMLAQSEGELPRRVQIKFIRRLQEAEGLAVAFRLMDDVDVALDALRMAVVAQISAEVATKYLTPDDMADGSEGSNGEAA